MPHVSGRQQQWISTPHPLGIANAFFKRFKLPRGIRPHEIDPEACRKLARSTGGLSEPFQKPIACLAPPQRFTSGFFGWADADYVIDPGMLNAYTPALIEQQREMYATVGGLGRDLTL